MPARRPSALALSLLLAALLPPLPARSAERTDATALRVRFGLTDREPTDWSGKIDVAGGGRVTSIRGVRWMAGDSADGGAFTVATRRQPMQSAADRRRVAEGGRSAGGHVILRVPGWRAWRQGGRSVTRGADRYCSRVPPLHGRATGERPRLTLGRSRSPRPG